MLLFIPTKNKSRLVYLFTVLTIITHCGKYAFSAHARICTDHFSYMSLFAVFILTKSPDFKNLSFQGQEKPLSSISNIV